MIGETVTDLIDHTRQRLAEVAPATIDDVRDAGAAIVGFSEQAGGRHASLKRFLRDTLYKHPQVRGMNEKTQAMIEQLFAAYMKNPGEMPPEFATRAGTADAEGRARVVADYIAGMTDRFAIAEHARLGS